MVAATAGAIRDGSGRALRAPRGKRAFWFASLLLVAALWIAASPRRPGSSATLLLERRSNSAEPAPRSTSLGEDSTPWRKQMRLDDKQWIFVHTTGNESADDETNVRQTQLLGGITSIGEYYASIQIGGQTLRVQVDTGSSTMAVPMKNCQACRPGDFRYDPKRSQHNDAVSVPCDSDICRPQVCDRVGCKTCSANGACCSTASPSDCGFRLSYGDGSGAQGALRTDVMHWSPALTAKVFFGGIFADTPDFESKEVDGILGMAYPALACNPTCVETPFDSLVRTTGISDQFTICIAQNGGQMTLGLPDYRQFASKVEYAPLRLSNPPTFYTVQLGGKILVDDSVVNMPDWKLGIVDSGTTLVVVSEAAFAAIVAEVVAKSTDACDSLPGLCSTRHSWFRPAGCVILNDAQLAMLPTISILVGHPKRPIRLDLTPDVYMLRLPLHATTSGAAVVYRCVGFMTMNSLSGGIDVILGNTLMMKYATIYDRRKSRIGFAEAAPNCGGQTPNRTSFVETNTYGAVFRVLLVLGLAVFALVIAICFLSSSETAEERRSLLRT